MDHLQSFNSWNHVVPCEDIRLVYGAGDKEPPLTPRSESSQKADWFTGKRRLLAMISEPEAQSFVRWAFYSAPIYEQTSSI